MDKDIALLKKVLVKRAERRKHLSYWAGKACRLMFLWIFKEEILRLTQFLWSWCATNLTVDKIFHTFALTGFVGAMAILFATAVSMWIRGVSFDKLPEEIESMLKKLDSLLNSVTEKVASL